MFPTKSEAMLIQKQKILKNHSHSFLSKITVYFNEQFHSVWRWLNPGGFTNTEEFKYGREIARQKATPADGDQSIQSKQQTSITVTHIQAQTQATVLHIQGALKAENYLDLIAKAREVYEAGQPHIILDMKDVPLIGLSGLVALYSLDALLQGKEPPDPTMGWETLHAMAHDLKAGFSAHLKLVNLQPEVKQTLEQAGFETFIEFSAG